jgi:hypothetical protein
LRPGTLAVAEIGKSTGLFDLPFFELLNKQAPRAHLENLAFNEQRVKEVVTEQQKAVASLSDQLQNQMRKKDATLRSTSVIGDNFRAQARLVPKRKALVFEGSSSGIRRV